MIASAATVSNAEIPDLTAVDAAIDAAVDFTDKVTDKVTGNAAVDDANDETAVDGTVAESVPAAENAPAAGDAPDKQGDDMLIDAPETGFTFDFSAALEEDAVPVEVSDTDNAVQVESKPINDSVKAEEIDAFEDFNEIDDGDASADTGKIEEFDSFDNFDEFEEIELDEPVSEDGAGYDAAANETAVPLSDNDIADSISDKIAAMRESAHDEEDGIYDDTLGEPESISDLPVENIADSIDATAENSGFDFDFSVFENNTEQHHEKENTAKKKRKNKKKK